MPDLSKMLGDVYDAPTTTATDVAYRPASPDGRPAPDWADDEHLDRAFAGWTPGPSADAPAAERNLFAGADEAPAPLADDLAAALSEAVLAEQAPEPAEAPSFDVEAEFPALTPVEVAPRMTATAFGGLTNDAPPRPAAPTPVPVEEDHAPEPAVEETAVEIENPEPMYRTSGAWQRADDDILPGGGGKAKFFSLSLRRR
jgi:hypothetical protein